MAGSERGRIDCTPSPQEPGGDNRVEATAHPGAWVSPLREHLSSPGSAG